MNRVDVFLIGGGLVAGLLLPFGVFFFCFLHKEPKLH
jgi:hypothetical protein